MVWDVLSFVVIAQTVNFVYESQLTIVRHKVLISMFLSAVALFAVKTKKVGMRDAEKRWKKRPLAPLLCRFLCKAFDIW